MELRAVAVIGAGVMGAGLAQNLAQTGHQVILLDVSDRILDRARGAIRQAVRFQTLCRGSGKMDTPKEVLERITFSTDLQCLVRADFVIESVPEKWEIKKEVYSVIEDFCPPAVVLASNTSAIPITRIAALTRRAEKVIGLHFMNPAPLKEFVEVICGELTSAETLATATSLLRQMQKKWLVVKDSPGFVTNRVLMLTINEAICLVYEAVATPEEVDRLFVECFGHRMGPLATADLIGLDTILLTLNTLTASLSNAKFRPCPLLESMVASGNWGCKSGNGFYRYEREN